MNTDVDPVSVSRDCFVSTTKHIQDRNLFFVDDSKGRVDTKETFKSSMDAGYTGVERQEGCRRVDNNRCSWLWEGEDLRCGLYQTQSGMHIQLVPEEVL